MTAACYKAFLMMFADHKKMQLIFLSLLTDILKKQYNQIAGRSNQRK